MNPILNRLRVLLALVYLSLLVFSILSRLIRIQSSGKICEGDVVIDGEDTAGDIAKVRGCSEINGDLSIDSTDLTDLSTMRKLKTVRGDLRIGYNYTLTSLAGLDNIFSLGGTLAIGGNDSLTNLVGLESLQEVAGDVLVGFLNRSNVLYNPARRRLSHLDNISSVGGDLYIWDNDALTSLEGLESLQEVKGDERKIYSNPAFDCARYNQAPPPYFPLTKSEGNKVDCITE